MGLYKNKDTGNFYPKAVEGTNWHCDYLWSTHMFCSFDCSYCSRKAWNNRFIDYLEKKYGESLDSTIPRRLKGEWHNGILHRDLDLHGGVFVSPYNDIMTLPKEDIVLILKQCEYAKWNESEPTTFIFQSKDIAKCLEYLDLIPEGSWLGTTIESDFGWYDITKESWYNESISKAPTSFNRYFKLYQLSKKHEQFKYFITIEPIMKFSKEIMRWMRIMNPDLIFIGANTSKVQLPEPTPDELIELIEQLKKITTVHLKSNLKRLLPATLLIPDEVY